MQQIQIDPEFKSLIPPLSGDEYNQLEANIISDGCRDALVVWNGILIDGHNRLEICTKHGLTYQTVEKELPDRQAAIEWIIRNQFGRRNLLPFQRSELALRLKPIIEARAKEKMTSGINQYSPTQKSAEAPIETRQELAKLAGVSHDTIAKAQTIQKSGTPEQIERARKGGTGNSVNAIYQEIKESEIRKCKECGIVLTGENEAKGKGLLCRSCYSAVSNPPKDFSGRTIKIDPQLNKTVMAAINDLHDTERQMDYTVDDMDEELEHLSEQYSRSVKLCLEQHSTLLSTTENKKKIIAALSEAETAIKKIKELLI